MRDLQVVGVAVSVAIALYGYWRYRQDVWSRFDILITFGAAFLLLTVSLVPAIGDLVAGPLEMQRWNAVIFISVALLFALYLHAINRITLNTRDITSLTHSLALREFVKERPELFDTEIVVIIPAYQEEDNIGAVLDAMPPHVLGRKLSVVVVVDGDVDRTELISREMGAYAVVHAINRGGGSALRTGYRLAIESKADIIVTCDADGQNMPQEIEKLVNPIIEGKADFVNGSRILGTFEKESAIRVVGIFVFNRLISLLLGMRVTDSSCAFRAIRRDILARMRLYQDQFHTSEFLIEAIRKGARFLEVPITWKRRRAGDTKKPPSLHYGWGYLKAIMNTWLR
ncbi:MAG: DUF2304 family protein [Candidatus Nitrospinota bacterium M3_3B_026]